MLSGGGADEHQAVFPAQGGKVGVLRQKPIPRVDGLGPGDQGGGNHPLLVEVAVGRAGTPTQ